MYTIHIVLTEKACDEGTFGDCISECGQCEGSLCNSQTGICTNGCQPGYQGDLCTQSKSIHWYYVSEIRTREAGY